MHWRFFLLLLSADNVFARNNIVFFRACTNSCVPYLWELPAKDTVCSHSRVCKLHPGVFKALITVQGSVVLCVAWSPKPAGGCSDRPSRPNGSAPTFPALLIVKCATLSVSTNVNFSQLASTRLVNYWLRGFARVAGCVFCQNQMFLWGPEWQRCNGYRFPACLISSSLSSKLI